MKKNNLDKLRKNLYHGAAIDIAENLGLSESFVYKVLSGQRKSQKVIEEAIRIAEEYKNTEIVQNEKIKAL